MRDRSRSAADQLTALERGKRFHRRFRGYATHVVDETVEELEARVGELETQAIELREELLDAQHVASETKHDLTRARAELRYWNDRASYVDSEVARARHRAAEMEQTARERADAIEADAQERSLQLVDRVCAEANAMLQSAREEAREMFLRFEVDVDMSQQKLERLESVRREVARTMQNALGQFEEAVRELDKVAPARRIVESLEAPVRRSTPTFGTKKAMDAARRFEAASDHSANAAMSSPLRTTTLAVTTEDVDASAGEETPIEAPLVVTDPIALVDPTIVGEAVAEQLVEQTGDQPAQERRTHEADEEFASLIIQP